MRMQLTLALLVLMLTAACQTANPDRIEEDFHAVQDYSTRNISEIVVLPVAIDSVDTTAHNSIRDLPRVEMRRLLRQYLIQQKDYVAPQEQWIDERIASAANLETDAILHVTVNQWDTSNLVRRGVIYAGADFQLKSPGGDTLLWTYNCRNLQLPIAGPHGGPKIADSNLTAIRLLTQTALSRIPQK